MPRRLLAPLWLHSLVWLTLLLGPPALLWRNSGAAPLGGLPGTYYTVTNLVHIGLFYGVADGLYARLFRAGRWKLFLLAVASLLAVVFWGKVAFVRWQYPDAVLDGQTLRVVFFPTVFFVGAAIIYGLGRDYLAHQREREQRRAAQVTTELKLLRSQVNPHFLFNVLNTIVALARKKSDQVEPALINLAGLMRYMLYESEGQPVPLAREVAYLTDFIHLQQLRFGTSIRVHTDLRLPEAAYVIEPMLLIPFVENAFKHGVGWVADPCIRIQLRVELGTLHFRVENHFAPTGAGTQDRQPGIGLANVRSRLDLLHPGRHQLHISAQGGIFSVHLTLPLP